MPTVSVVMPTFNRRALLPQVIAPLLADEAATEVIVVVDGCRDGSIEDLASMSRPAAKLKPIFIEKSGRDDAREVGIRAATSEVVLLLDDDVRAAPGLVSGHAAHHAATGGVLVIGYMPTRLTGPRQTGDSLTRLYAREYEACCLEYERFPERILHHLWAGNVSVRRADLARVGFARDDFRCGYHGDQEFGLRCLKAGLQGVFDRSLHSDHVHRRTLDAFLRDARSQGVDRVFLHSVHSDLLGPLPRNAFEQALPQPLGLWLRACRRWAQARDVSAAALRFAGTAAQGARLRSAEELVLRLLRRVEQLRGALDGKAS